MWRHSGGKQNKGSGVKFDNQPEKTDSECQRFEMELGLKFQIPKTFENSVQKIYQEKVPDSKFRPKELQKPSEKK